MDMPMNNFFILLTGDSVSAIIGCIILLFVGYICLKLGFDSLNYIRKGDKVEAVITRIVGHRHRNSNRSLKVYVDYEYNGQFYPNTRLHTYNSSFHIGKTITLYVFPDSPDKPEHSSSIITLPIGLGVIAFAILLLTSAIF